MQALAANCEELRARTGNPPLHTLTLTPPCYIVLHTLTLTPPLTPTLPLNKDSVTLVTLLPEYILDNTP